MNYSIKVRSNLNQSELQELRLLWNRNYPESLQHDSLGSLQNYLGSLKVYEHLLVIGDNGRIAGWSFIFERNFEPWFAIILDRAFQGIGLGVEMLDYMKSKYTRLSGWVVNSDAYVNGDGKPYRSPLKFYQKNGFKVWESQQLLPSRIPAVKVIWERG